MCAKMLRVSNIQCTLCGGAEVVYERTRMRHCINRLCCEGSRTCVRTWMILRGMNKLCRMHFFVLLRNSTRGEVVFLASYPVQWNDASKSSRERTLAISQRATNWNGAIIRFSAQYDDNYPMLCAIRTRDLPVCYFVPPSVRRSLRPVPAGSRAPESAPWWGWRIPADNNRTPGIRTIHSCTSTLYWRNMCVRGIPEFRNRERETVNSAWIEKLTSFPVLNIIIIRNRFLFVYLIQFTNLHLMWVRECLSIVYGLFLKISVLWTLSLVSTHIFGRIV